MTVGQKIKFYREKLDISQRALSEVSGVHPVSIRKYETDVRSPSVETLIKLANALQVNITDLLPDDDEKEE